MGDNYTKALDILSRRQHSEKELRKKLKKYCDDASEIDTIIARCLELNYLNDEKYARSLAEFNATSKNLSNRVISYKLMEKGIPSGLIESTLASLASSPDIAVELERARTALEKKFRKALPQPGKEREKAVRFLVSRGFSWDIIQQLIRE